MRIFHCTWRTPSARRHCALAVTTVALIATTVPAGPAAADPLADISVSVTAPSDVRQGRLLALSTEATDAGPNVATKSRFLEHQTKALFAPFTWPTRGWNGSWATDGRSTTAGSETPRRSGASGRP